MADYRYLCCDLLTNSVIAELPFTGVTYGQELNTAGSFSGHLLISDTNVANMDYLDATNPSNTALYIERDGQLVWGGVIWTRTYSSDEQTLNIGAREFESYFENRIVQFGPKTGVSPRTYDYAGSWDYTADLFTVVEDCFKAVRDWYLPNSNIGVIIPTNTLGVTLGTVANQYGYVINDFEFRPLLDVVYQLSRQASNLGGFDYNIDVAYDNSYNITKTLELTAKRGRQWTATDQYSPVLDMPGNVVSYEWPENGAIVANAVYGVGNGSASGSIWYRNPNLSSVAGLFSVSAGALGAGAPLLEKVYSVTNEVNPVVVGSMTEAAVYAYQYPVTVVNVTWDSINDPQIGSFKTGDEFRVRINDVRFPDGLDVVLRLSKFSVEAGESGPERITASLVNTAAFV